MARLVIRNECTCTSKQILGHIKSFLPCYTWSVASTKIWQKHICHMQLLHWFLIFFLCLLIPLRSVNSCGPTFLLGSSCGPPFLAWLQLRVPFPGSEQLWTPFPAWEQLWTPFQPGDNCGPHLQPGDNCGPHFQPGDSCGPLSSLRTVMKFSLPPSLSISYLKVKR